MRVMGMMEGMRKQASAPCVATVGFFDGVHLGHQHLIGQVVAQAKGLGLESTVITFARHPRQVILSGFKPQLLTTHEEKIACLAQTGIDNCVVLDFSPQMASMSARCFMQQVLRDQWCVRRLVIGYDNRFGHNREEAFDDYVRHGRELGIEVVQCTPWTVDGMHVSSSVVRRLLLEGDMEHVHACLGRCYSLAGRVVSGYHQGRKLGFPTANIQLDDNLKLLPKAGVYAARVGLEGEAETTRAVMNIGVRPTFDGHEPTIEVHVIRYEGDLYGKRLVVEPMHWWRAERKFDTLDLLVAQMNEDVKNTDNYFEKRDEYEK